MKIKEITIIGGCGKNNAQEPVKKVTLKMGDIVSIVGPTGCGKSTLINDIEMFASGNSPSKRTVLINGTAATEEDDLFDPAKNPIATITQHTNFLSDLSVKDFLETHAEIRQSGKIKPIIEETIGFANQLTGEPIIMDSIMTELSGGQTRALLIADAVIIGNSPIILLDEIENAGIHRTKALELLKKYEKIFVFVTHDPTIALLSDFRITMKNGAMQSILKTNEEEKRVVEELRKMDDVLIGSERIRNGEQLSELILKEKLKKYGYL